MPARVHARGATLAAALCLALVGAVAHAEKVEGYAEFRAGTSLVVDGQRIVVNDRTKYDGARRLSSIPLGYEVEVKGKRQPDGTLLARRMEVRRNLETDVEQRMRASFDEMENAYRASGRMAMADPSGRVVQDNGRLITDGPMVARVRRITADLVPPYIDADDLRVYVVENDEWNAMAAPNYSIYVFSGLLEALDDDEVAIVLGHELAHATHEHSRRQYQRGVWVQMGAVAGSVVAGEAIDNVAASSAAQLGTVLGASAIASGYSRDHEDQADRVGLRYAYEAGYDVSKGPALWERFSEKYGESGKTVNFFFGDHSRASKRRELLLLELERNYSVESAD
jgi:Zn-dependent protease with chaperone function